ncbi:MAG: AbrB/MazE/SpoVT family DNA-binding domain-containing protein [Bacilli bacterium]|jgi:antitoxin PrlF|nr:AbrB/MazE/SpoVT family DNA-binding domain-containing protein [Bacilli bacterium]
MIDIAAVSSKGQVTVPIEVRRALGLAEGSKIAFVSDEKGKIYLVNADQLSVKELSKAKTEKADESSDKSKQDALPDFLSENGVGQ